MRTRYPETTIGRHHGFTGLSGIVAAGLTAVGLLAAAAPSQAADWLAPSSEQTVTADWVEDIAHQLRQEPYNRVFINALGNTPQAHVIRQLNGAAAALKNGNKTLAEDYVRRTLAIFDDGVRRGWYSAADVEPIKAMIQKRAEAAVKGETVTTSATSDRWAGYTQQKPLGLTDDAARITREFPEQK